MEGISYVDVLIERNAAAGIREAMRSLLEASPARCHADGSRSEPEVSMYLSESRALARHHATGSRLERETRT